MSTSEPTSSTQQSPHQPPTQSIFSVQLFDTTYHVHATILSRTIILWIGKDTPNATIVQWINSISFENTPISTEILHDTPYSQTLTELSQILTKKLSKPITFLAGCDELDQMDLILLSQAIYSQLGNQ